MDLIKLHSQFVKGVAFFNERYAQGQQSHPWVTDKIALFEKQVIEPFDRACLRARPDELALMEKKP